MEGFLHYEFGVLYLEGRAYTFRGLFLEFYCII